MMVNPSIRHKRLRQIFTELITKFGDKDFDGFAVYFSEDTLFEWPYLPLKIFPSQITGITDFLEVCKAGMADCAPYRHKVSKFYDQLDPDMLIVEYASDTIYKPTEKRYVNDYLGIIRFEGEKIVYWREYINPLPVLEVYGETFENKKVKSNQKTSVK